ncbi:hypothetical protein ACFSL4_36740 [Streptomyces caeni]|uniref:Uncharacterized protein n=1 Tax=Streptomyces caeni TaxID=2307231 RepID=A0ABW4J1R1_9ACTN
MSRPQLPLWQYFLGFFLVVTVSGTTVVLVMDAVLGRSDVVPRDAVAFVVPGAVAAGAGTVYERRRRASR